MKIEQININDELHQNFIDFSYEANSQRAFADARDGLKPGQRACLWEMYDKGYSSSRPHVKSAKVSGGVVAAWWPHGTVSIYDTFARMSQKWINNIPEVDFHGANGSQIISGEAAADRYCVIGDTLISTNVGLIKIKDLLKYATDESGTLDNIKVIDYKGNYVPATKFIDSGIHPTKTVVLKNGLHLTGTYNHPVVVLDPSNCGFKWKRLDELTLDDKVLVPLFDYTKSTTEKVDSSSGDVEFKMLGSMISEGYITTQNRIGINNTDKDLIIPVKEFFESRCNTNASINYNKKRNYYEYCIANEKFYNSFIKEYNYKNHASEKEIPECVFNASLTDKSTFLRYLFEGDGGLVGMDTTFPKIVYSTYSDKLAYQLQIMLLQDFSILSFIKSSKRKTGIEYKLTISGPGLINFAQKINFVSSRKQGLLSKACEIYDSNASIANGSYYSTAEISYYIRKLHPTKYTNKHSFSNVKNFYRSKEYLDDFTYNRLKTLVENYVAIQISQIAEDEEQHVYSVRVDNPDSEHSFIANGFINHNTEVRLSKAAEDGLFSGIKKSPVQMIKNFSEDAEWPEVLPALMPRLMINGCQGIGVTIANCWLPHNLKELGDVIINYLQTSHLDYSKLAPDFPSGGVITNKNELSPIYATGKGKVILRAKTEIKGNSIFITEFPYQVYVEPWIDEVKKLVNNETISGIEDIYNRSSSKGILVEVECSKSPQFILNQLFKETDLQKSFNANQWALIGKTPKLLNLQEYLDVYIRHNLTCIVNENKFDLAKAEDRLEVVNGLLKALEDIDNIISLIKQSDSSKAAKEKLIKKYDFSEKQADAIIKMRLGSLAHLENVELNKEAAELNSTINNCNNLIQNEQLQKEEFIKRLKEYIKKYGDVRHTELAQIDTKPEDKEIQYVEPEKVVVIMTESGLIKRIPATSFRTQRRGGKGVKTADDVVNAVIRTNTVDSLMVFTDKGNMYRLIVDSIPEGTNTTKGISIRNLITMQPDENPTIIYSIYRDTDAKYILFTTKNGLVKKTSLDEYTKTKKKTGIAAIALREGDNLASVSLIKDEPIVIITKNGMCIKFDSNEITPTSRSTSGVKGINLKLEDEVVTALVVRDKDDSLGLFSTGGTGKKIAANDLVTQRRGGKGVVCFKSGNDTIAAAALINDEDNILVLGKSKSICISAKEVPALGRTAVGNIILKDKIQSASKV